MAVLAISVETSDISIKGLGPGKAGQDMKKNNMEGPYRATSTGREVLTYDYSS